jgi:CTP:molybdopterin cytidylyltransferase MocA
MNAPGGEVYAVLLAAGAGSRFGGPKLLTRLRGRPLVAYAAMTLAEAMDRAVLAGGVAVVNSGDTGLGWHLESAGLMLVENPESQSGIASSLRIGLRALERWQSGPSPRAALIVLADQPLLRGEVIARLVTAWKADRQSVRPRYAGQPDLPGHPVLLDSALWPAAYQLSGDAGLRTLFRLRPEAVRVLDVPGVNPDVDTPEDLLQLEDSDG